MTIYVQRGDTVVGLATRYLGNPSRWQDIVKANQLESPYIVSDRSGLQLRVVMPGDTLVIPAGPAVPITPQKVEFNAYGIDVGWGNEAFDLVPEGLGVGLDQGVQNLMKALYRRIITRPGELPGHRDYGCKVHRHLGQEATPTRARLAALDVRTALLADPRVVSVTVDAQWDLNGALILNAFVVPIPPSESFTLPLTIEGSRVRATANF